MVRLGRHAILPNVCAGEETPSECSVSFCVSVISQVKLKLLLPDQPDVRGLPDRGVLHGSQHRGGRRGAEPQRALRPLTEHHQREDLPHHLVSVKILLCAKMEDPYWEIITFTGGTSPSW